MVKASILSEILMCLVAGDRHSYRTHSGVSSHDAAEAVALTYAHSIATTQIVKRRRKYAQQVSRIFVTFLSYNHSSLMAYVSCSMLVFKYQCKCK